MADANEFMADKLMIESFTITATKTIYPQVVDLRWSKAGNLQMGRYFEHGTERGIEWTDVSVEGEAKGDDNAAV